MIVFLTTVLVNGVNGMRMFKNVFGYGPKASYWRISLHRRSTSLLMGTPMLSTFGPMAPRWEHAPPTNLSEVKWLLGIYYAQKQQIKSNTYVCNTCNTVKVLKTTQYTKL